MDYVREIPKCRACGAELSFIRTANGKNMPCEHRPTWVLPTEDGTVYYTLSGNRIRGRAVSQQLNGTVIGYLPHWGNCAKAPEQFRRRKPDDLTERIRAQVAKEKADALRRAERRNVKEAEERERQAAIDAQMSLFPGSV